MSYVNGPSMLRIVNVVASTRIKGLFDIEKLSQKLHHAQYDPEIFSGLVYRQASKPTIIMFSSGKISSQGATSEEGAKQAIIDTVNQANTLGAIIGSSEVEKIQIENIVGTASSNEEINLESLAENLQNVIYEPEQFPGLIYRPSKNSPVCLIFSSGKLVIVGGKSTDQISETFRKVLRTIKNALA